MQCIFIKFGFGDGNWWQAKASCWGSWGERSCY